MTVIDGNKICDINYKINDIKYAIKNNSPIEEKLNVIIVISNPCMYSRRIKLLKEFVNRIEMEEEDVNLFIVEMIYKTNSKSNKKQHFTVTDSKNTNHLQLETDTPLWHKENMINIAVKHLLPSNYKAFAWIDADIEFESATWAMDTLKILNGCKDVVQLWSHAIDMSNDETNMNIFNGFGYSYSKNKKYTKHGKDYWHPGYAWAITRSAYEKIGGLYDKGILGSGDTIMALSFINKVQHMNNNDYHEDYNKSMIDFQKNASKLRLGYVPTVIRHYYHGSKINRKYTERWRILINNSYSPYDHIEYDNNDIIIPSINCPQQLLNDIMIYFIERKEDD
jgi:hypothetical protein